MPGETNLTKLLAGLAPRLMAGEFVFCTLPEAAYGDHADLLPLASFREAEGLTLLIARETADEAGIGYEGVFKGITLCVHSSLAATGLTAAVSTRLAQCGISANVMAAYYHDHIFVPAAAADAALAALRALTGGG